MTTIKADVHGLAELEAKLLTLDNATGPKVLRAALRDAAKPLQRHMRSNARVGDREHIIKRRGKQTQPVPPGFLRKQIRIRSKLNARGRVGRGFGRGTVAIVKVGVFRLYYAQFHEFGTSEIAAKPFVRPAAAKFPEAVAVFRNKLKFRIEAVARQ